MRLDPGDGLAIGRIDKTVAEAQAARRAERGAFQMKAAAGAQLAGEAEVEAAGEAAGAQPIGESERVRQGAFGLLEPLGVIGDREMLGHVAFPGRHGAAIGLKPVLHTGSHFGAAL